MLAGDFNSLRDSNYFNGESKLSTGVLYSNGSYAYYNGNLGVFMKKINIGIIGLGTVGSGVIEILQKNKSLDVPIAISKIAELDRKKWKNCNLKSAVFTKDVNDILNDPDIDIVVELIGGCKIAKSIVLEALK